MNLIHPGVLFPAIARMLLAAVLVIGSVAHAQGPAVTIIIDDVGNKADAGEAAVMLPGRVTLAFLPHTPHAKRLAEQAHQQGKEVMLHLPMDAYGGNRLGPGSLNLHMTERDFKRTVISDLSAVPHAQGLNNHMGSLLTRHPGAMAWLMEAMQDHGGLYFIDSRTSAQTVAEMMATEYTIPNARRDIFLDNNRDPELIRRQFLQLLDRAHRRGHAIGIGHPYPETMAVLNQMLPTLEAQGIRLISASEMINLQKGESSWPASSSPSLKVVKSSKP